MSRWRNYKALAGLILAVGIRMTAEDKPSLTMPSEVTLTNGRVLRGVQVIRWERDRVILKYIGGADPIMFSLIKIPDRVTLESIRKGALEKIESSKAEALEKIANEKKLADQKAQLAAEEMALEEKREAMAKRGEPMKGQTKDQARWVFGTLLRTNDYDSGRQIQAVYKHSIGDTYYVYFTDGRVTSWQRIDRR